MTKRNFSLFLRAILEHRLDRQEQAAAPLKEGDTWQFNLSRQGQVGSSRIKMKECTKSPCQEAVKLYEVNGSQKNEIPDPAGWRSQGC